MNKKLLLKIILDIVMTGILIILMGFEVSGSLIHEILGIAVLLMIIIHNLLNIKWFHSVLTSKKKNYMTIAKVILNMLLTIISILLLISSIIISQHVFLFLNITNIGNWSYIHHLTAFLEIILVSVHIGFHWKMIMAAFRKMFCIKSKNKFRTFILRILAIILAILGIKASFDRNIATNLLPDSLSSSSDNDIASIESVAISTSTSTDDTDFSYNGVSVQDGDTLNDFLGNLHCTACPKHCSLLSPQCSKGDRQVSEAEAVYQDYQDNLTEVTTEAVTEANNILADNSTEASYESSNDDSTETIVYVEETSSKDTLFDLFADYVPIMGLYIAGTYYALEVVEKSKSKKKKDID